jgi:hypothetical protein
LPGAFEKLQALIAEIRLTNRFYAAKLPAGGSSKPRGILRAHAIHVQAGIGG